MGEKFAPPMVFEYRGEERNMDVSETTATIQKVTRGKNVVLVHQDEEAKSVT